MNRSQRLDRDLLAEVVSACESVARFVAGLQEETFLGDDLIQSAVWAKIIMVGEAASHLSASVRESHPEVPWRQIVSMRHRLVHDYSRVDWALVWRTAVNDVPALKPQISKILAEFE